MAGTPVCLVCKKEMERGFLTDRGHGEIFSPRWCPGEPQDPKFWFGEVKRQQFDQGVKVVAYRCPECEALRLYAPSVGEA